MRDVDIAKNHTRAAMSRRCRKSAERGDATMRDKIERVIEQALMMLRRMRYVCFGCAIYVTLRESVRNMMRAATSLIITDIDIQADNAQTVWWSFSACLQFKMLTVTIRFIPFMISRCHAIRRRYPVVKIHVADA